MEWHPETHSGPQMQLANLGEVYIDKVGVPGDHDKPVPPSRGPQGDSGTEGEESAITSLRPSASVRNVITGRQGSQTVFVYVTDQWQRPVQGAAASIVVHYQSGDALYECTPSNASGFTSYSFDIQPSTPGRRVVIDVTVTYYDHVANKTLTGATQTFFLPWW